MSTRRYGDDEVHQILSVATSGDSQDGPRHTESGGLTLEQLKQIGLEAGIEPARIVRAAATLDMRERPVSIQRSLGLPISLSREVALPRAPTDREWEQLIAYCRTTFGVQGQATSSGGLREWSEGSLHISVEPTVNGEQLRLSSRKEDGVALNGVGGVMGGMSLLMGAVVTAGGKPEKALAVVIMFGAVSLAAFGANLVRLPRWASARERQLQAVAEHTLQLLREAPPPKGE